MTFLDSLRWLIRYAAFLVALIIISGVAGVVAGSAAGAFQIGWAFAKGMVMLCRF